MPLIKGRISNRKYFFLLAGFSMVVVLSSIILAVYTIMSTNRSLNSLDRSHDINSRLERLMSHLNEAEANQRGYLLTNRPAFWEAYQQKKLAFDREFGELYGILKDDKEQEHNLEELKKEIDTRTTLMDENRNDFIKTRNIDSLLKEKIDEGRMLMDRVKLRSDKIEHMEEYRLKHIQEITFKSSRLSVYIILLTCGLSLLLLITILVVLNREYQAKAVIEKELVASERLLQQQVHKLNMSNKELEQFAYVASHDLQEPLRKIISFSEKIQDQLGSYPDEEVTNCLKRLSTSASRMRVLIDDLLNYSRATRAMELNETVSLDGLLRSVMDDLSVTIAVKKAKVITEKLEILRGNDTQLRQLFQNLLSNALKFNKSETPMVRFWGKTYTDYDLKLTGWTKSFTLKHPNYYCIFVNDNGIGFDPQYMTQIFVIFHRLHGRSEYEGTGIGLAICKRIVENHEGFIAAESEPGKGATFIVGLPINKSTAA